MNEVRRDATPRDHELVELVGRTIAGKYQVTRLIGRGGMGAVYEAEHLGIGRMVAIKFVDREVAHDEGVVSRFAREARATTAIESEHIVSVLDAGVDDTRPYLVMELLRGEDLGSRLRRVGRLPLGESLHVVAQILRGLARAHEAGFVHRDLKPDNVFLVRRENDPLFVKIVDFGISKIARARTGTTPLAITGKGTVLGTPLYMAPEQAQALSDVDGRADLYSAGAILFECLTGRPPHTGESYEQIILAICMHDAPDVRTVDPSIPPGVAAFLARALARHREDRFGSAYEAASALRSVAPDDPATLLVPTIREEHSPLSYAATVAMGSPTDVSWSAGSNPTTNPGAASRGVTRASAQRVTRSHARGGMRVAGTALLAMATGVAVTTWWLRVAPTVTPPDMLPDGAGAMVHASTSAHVAADPPDGREPRGSGVTELAPEPATSVEAPIPSVVRGDPPPPTSVPAARVTGVSRARQSFKLPTSAQIGGGRDPRAPAPARPLAPSTGLELQRDFP